ncbi:MAG: helix-turn-helix domain-containing protein, partial [Mycobacteriaceae bacterium]|nr:helix-turn-helix domain-containing protein [Mycobacteriaceae bacterium]
PTVVSQHLAKLRLAGLVKTRREGTFVYYSPADRDILRVLSQALTGADPGEDRPTSGVQRLP